MFTGLVEAVGKVIAVSSRPGGTLRVAVSSPEGWGEETALGDSIMVDGLCLTLAETGKGRFEFDAVPETVRRSTLPEWRPGRRVNLERALRLGDRLGGHIVTGHVDGTGKVVAVRGTGAGREMDVLLPTELSRFVAEKGSVALNGVSLTVASVEGDLFRVSLIPETLARTNLSDLGEGAGVNVEVDIIARYLERLLPGDERRGLSLDFLAEHGFA